MTATDDWILLSEAATLGPSIERIVGWLADDQLEARADEVITWTLAPRWENWIEPPLTGDTLRDVIANMTPPPDRYDRARNEYCHVYIKSDFWESNADYLSKPAVWKASEATIQGNNPNERKAFYNIRVNRTDLLTKACVPASAEELCDDRPSHCQGRQANSPRRGRPSGKSYYATDPATVQRIIAECEITGVNARRAIITLTDQIKPVTNNPETNVRRLRPKVLRLRPDLA